MSASVAAKTLSGRVFNFSAGPAALPLPVLEQAQQELLSLPGVGASILEISHRSPHFVRILQDAKTRLSSLLNIPDDYQILFLQGGSRLQFSMVPMNLLRGAKKPAEFVITGSWSQKAHQQAQLEGPTKVLWDGKETGYDRLPPALNVSGAIRSDPQAPFAFFTSNETIQGVQFPATPWEQTDSAPVVCDASSDFLSRPLPIEQYGLIYACAQKNAGPAGVTIVIIRKDLLQSHQKRGQGTLPGYLDYQQHAANDSLYNTAPTFGIYMVGLVAKWLQNEIGGPKPLEKMHQINQQKAQMLYQVIDDDGFYRGHAAPSCRSLMNVTFRLPSPQLETRFVDQAAQQQMTDLKGHRSVGGIRASIYNAMPIEGVELLAEFMTDFRNKNG